MGQEAGVWSQHVWSGTRGPALQAWGAVLFLYFLLTCAGQGTAERALALALNSMGWGTHALLEPGLSCPSASGWEAEHWLLEGTVGTNTCGFRASDLGLGGLE